MRLFYPKMYVSSITEIKPEVLKELGIRGVLCDLDNTVVRRDSEKFAPEVAEWLSDLLRRGFKLGIISNNSSRRVKAVAGSMALPYVYRAVKPLAGPFRRAVQMIGTSPGETALVGDQIFTDILGGNLAGLYTILVVPLNGREFWGTRLFSRPLEKIVLARLKKHPEVFHGRWD